MCAQPHPSVAIDINRWSQHRVAEFESLFSTKGLIVSSRAVEEALRRHPRTRRSDHSTPKGSSYPPTHPHTECTVRSSHTIATCNLSGCKGRATDEIISPLSGVSLEDSLHSPATGDHAFGVKASHVTSLPSSSLHPFRAHECCPLRSEPLWASEPRILYFPDCCSRTSSQSTSVAVANGPAERVMSDTPSGMCLATSATMSPASARLNTPRRDLPMISVSQP